MLKKILKIAGILLALLILTAFLIPVVFKTKILAIAREQINKKVNATVNFTDVDISLFRHFPRLSIGLDNLQVIGTEYFSKDTLISAKQIDLAVNLFSIFGNSGLEIYSINIDNPRIHALVNKEGKANWEITKPDTSQHTAETSGSFHLQLKSYRITDGFIQYADIPGDRSFQAEHLDHSGSGDFSSDLFILHTKTSAESVSFVYSKIPWLADAHAKLTADIEVDNKTSTYRFKTDDIHLNDLQLATEGFFRFVNDTTYGMDIQFHAPSNAFKSFLSLIPSIYKTDFDKIKTSGNLTLNGYVKGNYNGENIPSYMLNLKVDNGFFQYPDLPQPVKNIGIDMKIENPDGITDHTAVNITRGHIEFGTDPFDFTMIFKKPMSDQWIDARVKGKLNLADITRFVKLSQGTKLAGILDADASAKGNLSVISKQQAGPFTANGYVKISNLNYSAVDFPQPVKNGQIQINFQNPDGLADHTTIQVPASHIEIGNNPVDFSINLKTPVSNPVFDGWLKGKFDLADAKQFTSLPAGTTVSGILSGDIKFSGNKGAIDKKEYDKISSSGNLLLNNILYRSMDYPDGLLLNDASFTFNPQNITLISSHAEYLQSHFTASGSIVNAMGYVLKNESLSGSLDFHADQIDLNKLMSTAPAGNDPSKNKPASTAFVVPKNLSFMLRAKIDQMHHDKVDYKNLSGSIAINDEVVALKDVSMYALDGQLTASGFYSTKKDKKNPDISFTYDVKGLDVQKTFYAFNTVQKLMPVGQYVDGKINSQLTFNGKLGTDLSPDMNTLNGKGNLFIVEGAFKKFAPVEKMAQTLHISQLNGMSLKDLRFSFQFANGKVLVQPFKMKMSGIDMEIGGMHGFDQSIDYVIAMKIPRAMMGAGANALANNLVTQVNNKGIPVKMSDYINLKVDMVGTLTNPQIKTSPSAAGTDLQADAKQQADVFAKQATDSVKTIASVKTNEAKDSVKAMKNQAVTDVQKDLVKSMSGQKDSTGKSGLTLENTQKNAEKTMKNTLDNLFGKKKTQKDTSTVR